MKQLLINLLQLQTLELNIDPLTVAQESEIQTLRKKIPQKMLERSDRCIVRGKKAVALVRHGVCGECHLVIPAGTVNELNHPSELHTCDNCGRYLLLLDEHIVTGISGKAASVMPKKKARAKRACATA